MGKGKRKKKKWYHVYVLILYMYNECRFPQKRINETLHCGKTEECFVLLLSSPLSREPSTTRTSIAAACRLPGTLVPWYKHAIVTAAALSRECTHCCDTRKRCMTAVSEPALLVECRLSRPAYWYCCTSFQNLRSFTHQLRLRVCSVILLLYRRDTYVPPYLQDN